jgi:hypothetical protein
MREAVPAKIDWNIDTGVVVKIMPVFQSVKSTVYLLSRWVEYASDNVFVVLWRVIAE